VNAVDIYLQWIPAVFKGTELILPSYDRRNDVQETDTRNLPITCNEESPDNVQYRFTRDSSRVVIPRGEDGHKLGHVLIDVFINGHHDHHHLLTYFVIFIKGQLLLLLAYLPLAINVAVNTGC
jgi:hypothetical protein